MSLALPHYKKIERVKHLDHTRTNCLRLDMNEKPYTLPETVIKKITKQITPEKISTYPEIYPLYNIVSKKFNIPKENIIFTNGSEAAIGHIFRTYLDKEDTVLSFSPTFAMVPIYAKLFRVKYVEVEYDDKLHLNVDKLIEIIQNKEIKLLYLPNPNSPTGTILTDNEMYRLFKITEKNHVIFLLDEAYYPFYKKSYIDEYKNYDNLIITRTFSKYFGLPSIRLGLIVSNKTNIADIFKVVPTYEVNSFSILFGEKIFDFERILNKYLSDIKNTKKRVINFCRENNLDYISTHTNFMFIKTDEKTSEKIGKWLKEKKKILVKYGFSHSALKSCIRFSIGNKKQMDYLLSSIKEFLDEKTNHQSR